MAAGPIRATFEAQMVAAQALLAHAREVVADSRNHRHLAALRPALVKAMKRSLAE
jgi:hypothetical protein